MVVCFEKMAHFIYVVKINLWNYSYHPMIILLMCLMCLKGLCDIACCIPNICNLCLLSFILVLLLEFQFYYFSKKQIFVSLNFFCCFYVFIFIDFWSCLYYFLPFSYLGFSLLFFFFFRFLKWKHRLRPLKIFHDVYN